MVGDSRAEPSRIMPGSFESWLEKVLDSIFQEGVNSATLNFMNYTFYALFAVLTTLFLGSGLNLHVLALLLLAIALCLATNWFVSELYRESLRQKEKSSSKPLPKPDPKSE
ncbi:uncharacterized protein MRET_0089 [Malassezia restricta]|uniref:uncharacterized protein n=1 Tax=Malassezia restricta TaxID=76775 RepID=UPI000DD16D41|nr:uncharacterized protein MRET_0089 [Malassezia restricta]AXA48860.1 uncharacterized protein MRET_0089 [Malassezia restricta]